MNLKQIAATHAVACVTNGMRIGLGTGSTVRYVLEALAERLRSGALHDVVGVPTSEATTRAARDLGISLTTLDGHPWLHLTIDGADEVSPDLNLIKGRGGALLREKIVAAASKELLIVVDAGKRVERLGTHSPLPVEVLPFGWRTHLFLLERLGATARLRRRPDGRPYRTDNGNYMLDCTFHAGIHAPHALARALDTQPGILGHGLFLGMVTMVVVGAPEGIVVLTREE